MALEYLKKVLVSGLNVKKKSLEEELNSLGTGGPTDAVKYTPQELTEEQLIQVRKNLGLHYNGAQTVNIKWDKDTTGRTAIALEWAPDLVAYKVSDSVFSADDLIGAISTFDNGFTQKMKKEHVMTPCAGFTGGGAMEWFSANAGEYPEFSITVEESGTYFLLAPNEPSILSISNEININWDGDTTGKQQVTNFDGYNTGYCKVSSEVPSSDCLIGGNYSLENTSNMPNIPNSSFQIQSADIEQFSDNTYGVKYHGDFIMIIGTAGTVYTGDGGLRILPEDGIYFFSGNDWSIGFVSNLSYHTNAVHKIEQQYIPDTVATKAYVDQQIRDAIREAYNT